MPEKITPESLIISVEDIQVQSFIGVLPEEKEKINFFCISVYVSISQFDVLYSGLLSDTIDYSKIYNFIITEMSIPCNLIEEKIKNISEWLFEEFNNISSIKLKISKLNPLYMEKCNSASIEVFISKEKS
ncbi:MAG: dihydroneopterin aldolase [Bacteroidia bacterium]|nr:dihydroneopterin aldolase [Bacteroidia bacterium]